MVARIHIAIEFHDSCMAACLCQRTDSRLCTDPVGQGRVEQLDEIVTDIVAHPFVEECAEKFSPLLGRHRELSDWLSLAFLYGSQVPSVGVWHEAFNDGGELDIAATYLFEETVEVKGIVGIEIIDHCQRIPFHLMLVEQPDALYHLHERRFALPGLAVLVVKFLRPVD